MGCNDSLPLVPPRPAPAAKPVSSETQSRRSGFKRASTRLVSSISGSITENFKVLRAVSTNVSSTVLCAQDLQTGELRAIREISKSVWRENKRFFREVDILKDFDHPNIVKVFGTVETPLNYYNIFEFLEGGDLRNLAKTHRNEILICKLIRDAASALNYLHKQGIAHCNLSPASILITDEQDPIGKLTGFDFAQNLSLIEQPDYQNMNLVYASPEFLKKNFQEKTDVWSLGVIIYELLVGKHPCAGKEKNEIMKELFKGNLDFDNSSFQALSFNAQDFIKNSLNCEVDKRMSAFEALSHPWLAFTGKECIINYDALIRLRSFKIKSHLTRKILKYIVEMIEIKDHEIISVFKNIDKDFDGLITREEVIEAFSIVGIDAAGEIEGIMANIDIDNSGFLDFTEIKIALTDWKKAVKVKNLKRVFVDEGQGVALQSLKHLFSEILPHEWNEFSWKVKVENGFIEMEKLKEYIRLNIDS